MPKRNGDDGAGRASSQSNPKSAMGRTTDDTAQSHQAAEIQHFLETLRGPEARQFVEVDKSVGGNSLINVALTLDLEALLSLRLAVGGDAIEAFNVHHLEGIHLPSLAIIYKAPRCMAACLAAGADPNARDLETPLHYAAVCMGKAAREHRPSRTCRPYTSWEEEMADVERMVRKLKSHGADISLPDAKGNCALVHAINHGEWAVAAKLVEIFASEPGTQHMKIRFAAALKAVIAQEVAVGPVISLKPHSWWREQLADLLSAIARAWLVGGWNAGGVPGEHQPLQVAALVEAAVKRRAYLTLGWLCKHANAEAVRLSIRGRRAPLVHLALQADDTLMLGGMLGAGLDVSLPNEVGQSVLHSAVQLRRTRFSEHLLECAPQEQLLRLLTHIDDEGLTALGFCVFHDRPDELALVLRACERAGLDVSHLLERHTARTAHHWPVFAAVLQRRTGVLELLLPAGLNPESPACREHFESSNKTGIPRATYVAQPSERTETVTLLMCAASIGNLPAVRLLLAGGADARCSPAGNRFLLDAVTMVLGGLQLKAPLKLARPDFEISALAEPWLRHWEQDALEGRCGAPLPDTPEPPTVLTKWLRAWAGEAGAGARFECLLLLLWHGAALLRHQVGDLLALLDACTALGQGSAAATALYNFVFERLKPCGRCGLLGRWPRCACKRVWYCSRACQTQHWKARHERECPLAQQPRPK